MPIAANTVHFVRKTTETQGKMTDISLIGIPMDDGAGRPGCIMGPAAYRTAGLQGVLASLGYQVADLGDLAPQVNGSPQAVAGNFNNLAKVAAWSRSIHEEAVAQAQRNTLPIYMGGDHALCFGTLTGHAAAAKHIGRKQYVLWLDAHSDFNTGATSPSGNMHGMPMAFACGLPGFPDILGHPLPSPLIPEQVCMLGLRSVDREESKLLNSYGLRTFDMRAIDEQGIVPLLAPFLEEVARTNGLLHVSLDVDFLDPEIAPAVGTTVPGGATFREAHLIMEMISDSRLLTSLDLVELNPFLDERGRTARLMVELTASLFGRRVLDRPTLSF